MRLVLPTLKNNDERYGSGVSKIEREAALLPIAEHLDNYLNNLKTLGRVTNYIV